MEPDITMLAAVQNGVAEAWAVIVSLARGQPLGALITLFFVADMLLTLAGAVADRLEGVTRSPARAETPPPTIQAATARAPSMLVGRR